MNEQAPLILLVGMHRSGTSLLGSLLPQLGVPLPGELIDADQHNPEGYYERRDITDLQEQLLIDLGHWWPSQQGVLPLPADWLDHPATRGCKDSLRQLLRQEQQQQRSAWAIKDPRTSLLLPLWRELSEELALPLKLVLSVRDPREVMVSLQQRDQQAAGMTAWRAQQLWWRHHIQLLADAASLPLHVLHYSRWFSEPAAQLQQLTKACGSQASPEAMAAALALIKPQHRRSHSRIKRWPPIHPQLRRFERRLLQLSDHPEQRNSIEQWAAHQPSVISLPFSHLRHRQR
jgi:hypothetical protein